MRRNLKSGQAVILHYLTTHPGIIYTPMTLAQEMDAMDEAGAVGKSLTTLANKGDIERAGTGKYFYRSHPKAPTPTPINNVGGVLEIIGIRKTNGNPIVRDTDNNLYELIAL